MTAYSEAKSKTATLVAATEDTVTITGRISKLQVVNFDTSARISVRWDGTAATEDGDDTIPVPAGSVVTLYDIDDGRSYPLGSDQTVSLISAGTATYCVVAF